MGLHGKLLNHIFNPNELFKCVRVSKGGKRLHLSCSNLRFILVLSVHIHHGYITKYFRFCFGEKKLPFFFWSLCLKILIKQTEAARKTKLLTDLAVILMVLISNSASSIRSYF